MVIANKWVKYIEDVIPHSNRIVELRMRASAPLTVLCLYAPQAGRPMSEKDDFYKLAAEAIKKITKKNIPSNGGPECKDTGNRHRRRSNVDRKTYIRTRNAHNLATVRGSGSE